MATHIATFLLKVFPLDNYASTSTDIQMWMDKWINGCLNTFVPSHKTYTIFVYSLKFYCIYVIDFVNSHPSITILLFFP